MRIVILSTLAPDVCPMVHGIVARHGENVRVLRCYWERTPGRPGLARRLLKAPVRVLRQLWRSAWTSSGSRREFARVAQLQRDRTKQPTPTIMAHANVAMHAVATEAFTQQLTSLAPDVLLLLGAPRVGRQALAVAPLGTWNLHLGIPPDFRGEDTLFHAWCARRYDALGVTLHRADAELDQGPIAAQAFPALTPATRMSELLTDALALGAELVLDLLAQLQRGPVAVQVQPAAGRTWRRTERTRAKQAWFWLRRRLGGLRPAPRAQCTESVRPDTVGAERTP